jgi:hypothetical protein
MTGFFEISFCHDISSVYSTGKGERSVSNNYLDALSTVEDSAVTRYRGCRDQRNDDRYTRNGKEMANGLFPSIHSP